MGLENSSKNVYRRCIKRRYNVLFKDDMFCFNEPSKTVLPYLKHKRMGWFGDDNRFTLCALNNIHIYTYVCSTTQRIEFSIQGM